MLSRFARVLPRATAAAASVVRNRQMASVVEPSSYFDMGNVETCHHHHRVGVGGVDGEHHRGGGGSTPELVLQKVISRLEAAFKLFKVDDGVPVRVDTEDLLICDCVQSKLVDHPSVKSWGLEFERAPGASSWTMSVVKMARGRGHAFAEGEVGRQLGNYAEARDAQGCLPLLTAGGGLQDLEVSDDYPSEKRLDPDTGLRPYFDDDDDDDDNDPRILVEVEVENRSPQVLAKHALELFGRMPRLRVLVGIKVYKRDQPGGPFPAVCSVYRKHGDDEVHVERIFQCGRSPQLKLGRTSLRAIWDAHVPPAVLDGATGRGTTTFNVETFDFADLPDDDLQKGAISDELRRYFTVTISKDDVYYGCDVKRPPGRAPPDLDLDLFDVLRKLDRVKSANFV